MLDEKYLTDAHNEIDAYAANVANLKEKVLPTVKNTVESKPAAYYKSTKEVCPVCGKEMDKRTGVIEGVGTVIEFIGTVLEIATAVLH